MASVSCERLQNMPTAPAMSAVAPLLVDSFLLSARELRPVESAQNGNVTQAKNIRQSKE